MSSVRCGAAGTLALALSIALIASAVAQGPLQLTPPSARRVDKPPAKSPPRKPVPAQTAPAFPPAPPVTSSAPARSPSATELDLAYGAFQRGFYLTAFAIATRRVDETKDVKAMTLLGELYANGLGVSRDEKKAVAWYQLAVDRGDREAMFALAILHLAGRTNGVNREQGAKLLASAAKLGHITAAYDLGILYLGGQLFPQDFARAAELFRAAAQAGSPEAQYALATLYKEGRGVPKDLVEAARLLAAASAADNTDAQVEYAIALFNGSGTARNEQAAAILLKKAARKGHPVAQNRLANVLAVGRGLQADPVQAIKWHIVAKAGGVSDIPLDTFVQKQAPDIRAAGEKAAQPWVDALREMRESRS
jgi:TPR repeat protein